MTQDKHEWSAIKQGAQFAFSGEDNGILRRTDDVAVYMNMN